MIKRSTVYFFATLLLVSVVISCTEEGKRTLFGLRKTYPPSIIRNQLLFSNLSNEFSFPIWFNDSLISLNKISKITRLIYPKSLTEASRGDSLHVVPSETITYFFQDNGAIEKINRAFYFDDRKISEFEFLYTKSTAKDGFSEVQMSQDSIINGKALVKNNITETQLAIYNRRKSTLQFIEFENRITGDFLYVIPKKKYSGPMDIDRYIRPNPKDILVLGNTYKPNKIYRVENKVNETNVVEFIYKKESIKSIRTYDYPFHSTRSFIYDKRGYCTGFIDSTFSENNYLTRTISQFQNNMKFTPSKIFHRKENSEGKLTLINYEEFFYEYRK